MTSRSWNACASATRAAEYAAGAASRSQPVPASAASSAAQLSSARLQPCRRRAAKSGLW